MKNELKTINYLVNRIILNKFKFLIGIQQTNKKVLTADKLFGPVNTLISVTLCAGLSLYTWISVSSLNGLFAFCTVYGFFAAGVQSLFPAACASLSSTDMSKVGIRTGMCFSLVSVACLTGPPIAGALVQRREGDF